jgi:tRNA modification GTPase
MIVRTSGPRAVAMAHQLSPGIRVEAGAAQHVLLRFASLVCPAWIYLFLGPRSYTGDDLVEYHLPGNPVLARLLVADLQDRGPRPAEPGEFTARAYFNGRMDLTEAEGVAATVAAGSEQELAAARLLLAGELARRLAPAMELLAATLALVEADLDFSDELHAFPQGPEIRRRTEQASELLVALLADSARFEQLSHEPSFVLLGRPNAGKSSLLNALAGYQRAVESPVAGTTRDALSAHIQLPRGRVRIFDVAGLEEVEPAPVPDDLAISTAQYLIEQQMRERALQTAREADFRILVQPVNERTGRLDLVEKPDLLVFSKLDLAMGDTFNGEPIPSNAVAVSVMSGEGLNQLGQRLDALAFGRGGSEARLALNLRHIRAIEQAIAAQQRAAELAEQSGELCAAYLREALDSLGQVLGQVSPDEILGRIFSQFCMGK